MKKTEKQKLRMDLLKVESFITTDQADKLRGGHPSGTENPASVETKCMKD